MGITSELKYKEMLHAMEKIPEAINLLLTDDGDIFGDERRKGLPIEARVDFIAHLSRVFLQWRKRILREKSGVPFTNILELELADISVLNFDPLPLLKKEVD